MNKTLVVAMLGAAAVAVTAKPQAEKPAPPIPVTMTKAGHASLAKLTGSYAPLELRWTTNNRVADVLAVFPHPIASTDIYLATAAGLMKSTDAGGTFTALPQGTVDKIGRVTAIAFAPDDARKLVIATADHGLQISTDGGTTVTRLAGKSNGLIADAVRSVYFAPDDPFHRSLIAVHGEDTPGLSRSTDGGRSWQPYYADKHIYSVFFTGGTDGKEMLFDAAPSDDAAARSLWFTPSITEAWQKLVDDVIVTGFAPASQRSTAVYLATATKGIFRVARQGGMIRNVNPPDLAEWSSFGWTFDATADAPIFYGYHGPKLGLVTFTPKQLEPGGEGDESPATPEAVQQPRAGAYRTASDGLFTGPLVLEGSHIRANSGGTAYFAVINRQLYQAAPAGNGPAVLSVAVTPANSLIDPGRLKAVDEAMIADLQAFTTTHRVAEASAKLKTTLETHLKAVNDKRVNVKATIRTVATDPAASVTVDLSRLGMSATAPLFDDGQHGDDAKGDGVYGNTFAPDLLKLQPPNEDWRERWPGPIRLTVSVLTQGGTLVGGVGSMTLYRLRESIPFADGISPSKNKGNVAGATGRSRDYKQQFKIISIRGAGEWGVSMGHWRDTVDISAMEALTFTIRASAPVDTEISLTLRDSPTYTRRTETQPVKLKSENFIAGGKITTTEQRVVIPVSRRLKDAGDFQAAVTSALTLSGTVDKPVDLMIRDIKFVPSVDQEETP